MWLVCASVGSVVEDVKLTSDPVTAWPILMSYCLCGIPTDYFPFSTSVLSSVLPSFGPQAGGTFVNISGVRLNSTEDIRLQYVCLENCFEDQPFFIIERQEFIEM